MTEAMRTCGEEEEEGRRRGGGGEEEEGGEKEKKKKKKESEKIKKKKKKKKNLPLSYRGRSLPGSQEVVELLLRVDRDDEASPGFLLLGGSSSFFFGDCRRRTPARGHRRRGRGSDRRLGLLPPLAVRRCVEGRVGLCGREADVVEDLREGGRVDCGRERRKCGKEKRFIFSSFVSLALPSRLSSLFLNSSCVSLFFTYLFQVQHALLEHPQHLEKVQLAARIHVKVPHRRHEPVVGDGPAERAQQIGELGRADKAVAVGVGGVEGSFVVAERPPQQNPVRARHRLELGGVEPAVAVPVVRSENGGDLCLGEPVTKRAGATSVGRLEHAPELRGVDDAVAVGVGGGELGPQVGEVAEGLVGEEGRGGLPGELGGVGLLKRWGVVEKKSFFSFASARVSR